MSKCRESVTIKSACSNTKWSTEYQTLHWSLKDSGTGKDCRTFDQRDSFECTSEDSNTQVQHIDMNSQKVPKVVEVPKQQYTDLNVDAPAEMERQITSTHRKQKAEQVSVSCTSGRRHCRVTTTRVNDSKGTRVSTLTRRATRAE